MPERGRALSLFDIFFPHAPLAGRCTRKIKDNCEPYPPPPAAPPWFQPPCFSLPLSPHTSHYPSLSLFFQKLCLNTGTLFLRPLTLGSVLGQLPKHGVNAACNLPQKPEPTYVAARTHRLHDKSSQECFPLTLRGAYCQALEADGDVMLQVKRRKLKRTFVSLLLNVK